MTATKQMRRAGLLSAVALAAVAQPLSAAVIYDSGGFEEPRFAAGAPLEGQDPAQGPWVRSGGTASSATVQSTVVQSGSQAVQVNRQGDDTFWGVIEPEPAVAGQIAVEWDLNVVQATHAGDFGPFFGVQAYDALDNAPLLIGAAGIDAKTGEFLYQEAGTGNLVAGPVLTFNTWHRFSMVLDYDTDTYSVLVNGSPLLTGEGFVDDPALGEIDDFTDAPLVALAAGNSPQEQAAAGTAFYDNYRVVPEPAALSLIGMGALALLGRRARRAHPAVV